MSFAADLLDSAAKSKIGQSAVATPRRAKMNFPIDKTDEWEERQDAHKQPGALPEQHSVTTMQGLRDELALAQEQITRLERELAEARAQVLDWENREAAICPEDVGFEELLHVLQSKLAALTKPVSAVEFKQFAHPDDWGVDCTYINACNELIAARAQSTRRKDEAEMRKP